MSKTQYEVSSATHQWVRAIAPGIAVNTVLVVESASLKEARNGPFWMLELKDATGSLSARVWSPLSQQFTDIPVGSLVVVEGRAERYREQIQCSVTGLRVLDADETAAVDASIFMPASARSPLIMLEELEAMADSVFVHEPWKLFIRRVLRDDDIRPRLLKASAARGIHHARVGGLLEHTLGVARLCLHFVELYPQLDRQTLLAGAICHDLGKLWELTSGLTTDYTDEGRLAGHIFLGLERLRPHMEAAGLEEPLRLHLQHLVLSHHGQYEFGSPRLPQTAEALALHYADNVDAKMDQCRSLFGDMAPQDGAWSPFQRSLERAMYRAPRTPEETSVPDERACPLGGCDEMPEEANQEMLQEVLQEQDFASQEMTDEVVHEMLQEVLQEEDFVQNFPQDDAPQDDIPQDAMPESEFIEVDLAADMPDYEDDPGPDDLLQYVPDGNADSPADCPADSMIADPAEDVLPDMPDLPDLPDMADEPEPVDDTESVDEPEPVDETGLLDRPEDSHEPEAAASEAGELAPEEHAKTKKSRLEARQCSLL